MRVSLFLLVLFLGGILSTCLAQNYFEGELDYKNVFIDKQSYERLYEDISEIVTIKDGKYKLTIIHPQEGQLNWQIDDFEHRQSYVFKGYCNLIVPATKNDSSTQNDSSAITKDSASILQVNDSSYLSQVYEIQLCRDSSRKLPPNKKYLRILDTIIVIAGLNCQVMEEIEDGFRIAEYYYCDSIKINPLHYSCMRMDGDDKLYKFTNGSLITKRVLYDIDTYIYVNELQAIREKKINKEFFELPKDLQLIQLNKQ